MPKKKINISTIKSLAKDLDKKEKIYSEKLKANYNQLGSNAKKQLNTFLSGSRKSIKPDIKSEQKLKSNIQKYFRDLEKTSLKSAKKELTKFAKTGKDKIDIANIQASQSIKGNSAWASKLAKKQSKDYAAYIDKSIKDAIKARPDITKKELQSLIDKKTENFINTRLDNTIQNESNRIQNQVRLESYRKSKLIQGVIFTAVLDDRTTQNCLDKDGTQIALNNPKIQNYIIPQHPKCRSMLIPVSIEEPFKETSNAAMNIQLLKHGRPDKVPGQPVYFAKYFEYENNIYYEFIEAA